MFKPLLACNADLSKICYPVYVSAKLDGIRCVVVNGVAMSRSMKPIPNRYIQSQIARYADVLEGLDGELIVGEPTAKNCYNASVSGVMSADGEPEFSYHVFDRIKDAATYRDRWILTHDGDALAIPFIEFVVQALIESEDELNACEQHMVEQGYEGIMVRSPDGRYKQGRSTVREAILLKVKRFDDSEAVITGFDERQHNGNEATTNELGRTQRSSHQENMVGRGDLGALVVRCDKYCEEFRIGTGFDDATRALIWQNRSEWLGKTVKFKHQISGELNAPRFPVYLGLRSLDDL